MTAVRKVRVPARVAAHVLEHATAPDELRLAGTIRKVTPRADGSRLVTLDDDEAHALRMSLLDHQPSGDAPLGDRLAWVRAAQAIRKALR